MAYQIQGRLFSLRWRWVLLLFALLTLGHLTVFWLGWSELKSQQRSYLDQQHRALMLEYDKQISLAESKLKQQLSAMNIVDRQEQELSYTALEQRLPQLWRWAQTQQSHSLGLYSADLTLIRGYGDSFSAELPWLSAQLEQTQLASYLHCQHRCELLITLPLQVEGRPHLLLLATDLITALQPLHQPVQQEFALIAAPYNQPIEPLAFYGLSNAEQSMTMFSTLLSEHELPLLSNQQHQYQGQNWGLYSWPIDGQGTVFILLQPLNHWAVFDGVFGVNLIGLLGFNLLLLLVCCVLFANRLVSHIQRIKTALPLLPQGRFDDFYQQLPKNKGYFYDELDLLQHENLALARQLERQGSDIKSYTQALQQEAMLDPLTSLPGRAMLMYELGKTLLSIGRINEQIVLLLVDLDEFKRSNDTLGHEIGDELLKVMASRLQSSVRTMDSVCRTGSDEFAILIRGLAPDTDIHRVIHQLFHRSQQPIQLGHHRLITTVSIGVAFCDNPRVKPEELIKRADLALYQAKQAGRSNYRVFDEQMLKSASHRLMLEQELIGALQQQQLSLAMLPVVSLSDQKVMGFEALIRWHHPSRGLVMPAEFVQEVDGSESGMQLGHYVLEQAIQSLARFSEQLDNRHFYLSVNLSPQQYLQAGPERLQALLARHQVEPNRLILELTEESLIKDLENAQAMMKQLKQIGVRIAVDDFGTGYSSLSYLKQLPFDQLKVDRGFVAGLDHSDVDRKIVTNVIELAHHLNRKVVAEGVESHDQHQFLLQIDCDYAQGYLFCAPLEPHQLQVLFAQLDSQLHWPYRQLNTPVNTQQSR